MSFAEFPVVSLLFRAAVNMGFISVMASFLSPTSFLSSINLFYLLLLENYGFPELLYLLWDHALSRWLFFRFLTHKLICCRSQCKLLLSNSFLVSIFFILLDIRFLFMQYFKTLIWMLDPFWSLLIFETGEFFLVQLISKCHNGERDHGRLARVLQRHRALGLIAFFSDFTFKITWHIPRQLWMLSFSSASCLTDRLLPAAMVGLTGFPAGPPHPGFLLSFIPNSVHGNVPLPTSACPQEKSLVWPLDLPLSLGPSPSQPCSQSEATRSPLLFDHLCISPPFLIQHGLGLLMTLGFFLFNLQVHFTRRLKYLLYSSVLKLEVSIVF